jgi:GNAT superfamily N-acetyltransferase
MPWPTSMRRRRWSRETNERIITVSLQHTGRPATTVREAGPGDAHTVLTLIDALADYEKLARPDAGARQRLIRDMFAERPRMQVYLAHYGDAPAGYAFVFETYSSFLALPTLYLEDIFILPDYRSKRIGFTLFSAMVGEAHRRGCGRMEWSVLAWNRLAIDFYERLGARHMKEWYLYRLERNEMEPIITMGQKGIGVQ